MTVFFVVLAAAAGTLLAQRQGVEAVTGALLSAGELIALVIPLVVIAIVMAAYAQALLPREIVERWLGRDAGWRGLFIAIAAGAVTRADRSWRFRWLSDCVRWVPRCRSASPT